MRGTRRPESLTPGRVEVQDPGGTAGTANILELEIPGMDPVPLRYVEIDGALHVLSSSVQSVWVRRLLVEGGAMVRVRGDVHLYSSTLVTDPQARTRVIAEFRRVHGNSVMTRYFDRPVRVVALTPSSQRSPASYAERIRWEFDSVAADYTLANERDPLESLLKERSRERIRSLFAGGGRVLEIGPGTGLETLPLLATGTPVLAVDVSRAMLDQLEARAEAAHLSHLLEVRVGSLGSLGRVLQDLPDRCLAGAYTTYGAFNLEPRLPTLASDLGRLISPGGWVFVATLSNRALAPLLYALLEGRLREIRDRLRSPIPPGPVGYFLEVYPRSPGECQSFLSPHFHLERVEAATVLAPPRFSPRLYHWLGISSRRRLARVDAWLARHWPGAWLGEWEFLTFQRNREPGHPGSTGPSAKLEEV
jgi:SAM-dependent methyltransferase